jgi:hypothetical protein
VRQQRHTGARLGDQDDGIGAEPQFLRVPERKAVNNRLQSTWRRRTKAKRLRYAAWRSSGPGASTSARTRTRSAGWSRPTPRTTSSACSAHVTRDAALSPGGGAGAAARERRRRTTRSRPPPGVANEILTQVRGDAEPLPWPPPPSQVARMLSPTAARRRTSVRSWIVELGEGKYRQRYANSVQTERETEDLHRPLTASPVPRRCSSGPTTRIPGRRATRLPAALPNAMRIVFERRPRVAGRATR